MKNFEPMSKNNVSLASAHVRKLVSDLQPGKRLRSNVLEYMQTIGETYLTQLADAMVEVSRQKNQSLLTSKHVLEAHQLIDMAAHNDELEEIGLKNNKRRKMRRWAQMSDEEKAEEAKRRYERAQLAMDELGPSGTQFRAKIERNFMETLPPIQGEQEDYDIDSDDELDGAD